MKERIARRLEGIESDAPPALVPGGLVANRMLEEDPPRYTRASDPCEPCVMGKHGMMCPGLAAVKQAQIITPSPPLTLSTPSTSTSGSTESTSLSSKAERIARYKAERRRQLSERYGILLDQEADSDYIPRYRSRRDPDSTDRRTTTRQDRDRPEVETQEREPRVPYRSGVGKVYMRTHPDPAPVSKSSPSHSNQAPPPSQDRPSRFSERERVMNMENHRRGGAQERSVSSRTRTQEQHPDSSPASAQPRPPSYPWKNTLPSFELRVPTLQPCYGISVLCGHDCTRANYQTF
uniref:Supervillin a n=1 Tax=Amphilophus citrinellus TaxID=61819 RepID=A0A3Q0S983_AMPCI